MVSLVNEGVLYEEGAIQRKHCRMRDYICTAMDMVLIVGVNFTGLHIRQPGSRLICHRGKCCFDYKEVNVPEGCAGGSSSTVEWTWKCFSHLGTAYILDNCKNNLASAVAGFGRTVI